MRAAATLRAFGPNSESVRGRKEIRARHVSARYLDMSNPLKREAAREQTRCGLHEHHARVGRIEAAELLRHAEARELGNRAKTV
ncbi:MAG TPA: hypothetical protein VFY80_03660 [Burkholderiales bacterium]|nr:hypothetical protein [Burkholderiales bacterium]